MRQLSIDSLLTMSEGKNRERRDGQDPQLDLGLLLRDQLPEEAKICLKIVVKLSQATK